jgi:DNA-binding transcriptional ArsR family regulator
MKRVAILSAERISMLKALADETRWNIVRELLLQPLTVGELSQRLKVSHYNVSKHARVLREAGIVATDKKGQHVECRVAGNFRRRLRANENILDLGCCTFHFDLPGK